MSGVTSGGASTCTTKALSTCSYDPPVTVRLLVLAVGCSRRWARAREPGGLRVHVREEAVKETSSMLTQPVEPGHWKMARATADSGERVWLWANETLRTVSCATVLLIRKRGV